MGEELAKRRLVAVLGVDSGAGAVVGVAVIAFRAWLADLHAFPVGLVTFLGCANLAYASYSGTLAWRASRGCRPSRRAIDVLVAANAAWALVCAGILVVVARTATVFGFAHVGLEGVFVLALALLEARLLRPLTA